MVKDFEGDVPELGPFEQQVMLAILVLGDGTYGAPVYEKVGEIAGKRINQGAFYTTLDRMEEKGLLSSKATDPRKEPRGRPRYLLSMTPLGKKALARAADSAGRMAELYSENAPKPERAPATGKLARKLI
jgi:PadR family transcriptional regulator, regulatory protein PadR